MNKESLFKVKLEPLNKKRIIYKTFIGHWFVKNKNPPTLTPLIHFHPFINKLDEIMIPSSDSFLNVL